MTDADLLALVLDEVPQVAHASILMLQKIELKYDSEADVEHVVVERFQA